MAGWLADRELLPEPERAVLRRMSVFAAPFTVAAADSVLADWPPVSCDVLPAVLAGLAEASLLVAVADGGGGVRYGAPETIRQYGGLRADEAGEVGEGRGRHLRWCLSAATALARDLTQTPRWRTGFDLVADELRAGLRYACSRPQTHPAGFELAVRLAELSFARGWPAESQLRYEQAAGIAADDRARARMLGLAAAAAATRHFGNDALRLFRARAEAERAGGDPVAAAISLARAEEGLRLARQAGDTLAVSAALDELSVIQMAQGRPRAGMDSARQRIRLLSDLPISAELGLEVFDAYGMAADYAIGVGVLHGARVWAQKLRELPFNREEGHLATSRLMLVTALAGDWDETTVLSARFLEGWERNGRPRAGNLSRGAYATAIVYGLRGDDPAMAAWRRTAAALVTPGAAASHEHFDAVLDSWLLLHRGDPEGVLGRLSVSPEAMNTWFDGIWRPWYAAAWAEAAAITGSPQAATRIERALQVTADNPIARAMVERAAALVGPDGERAAGMTAAANALQAAGSRYQGARTLVLAGGADRAEGEAAMAAMGATSMVWPPQE